MPNSKACYRKLRHYKYQLVENYALATELERDEDLDTPFIALTAAGKLTVKDRYAWDGPSGPTFDTRSFMRGSLVHDALYQLMREEYLDYKKDREYADDLLKQICREDGMSKFRAWYVHKALRLFGEKAAKPSPKKKEKIICVP